MDSQLLLDGQEESSLMKFDIKNKLNIMNKDNSQKTVSDAKETENSLKKEMIASILRRGAKTNEEEKPVTFVDRGNKL